MRHCCGTHGFEVCLLDVLTQGFLSALRSPLKTDMKEHNLLAVRPLRAGSFGVRQPFRCCKADRSMLRRTIFLLSSS